MSRMLKVRVRSPSKPCLAQGEGEGEGEGGGSRLRSCLLREGVRACPLPTLSDGEGTCMRHAPLWRGRGGHACAPPVVEGGGTRMHTPPPGQRMSHMRPRWARVVGHAWAPSLGREGGHACAAASAQDRASARLPTWRGESRMCPGPPPRLGGGKFTNAPHPLRRRSGVTHAPHPPLALEGVHACALPAPLAREGGHACVPTPHLPAMEASCTRLFFALSSRM